MLPKDKTQLWIRISVWNLLVVASIGVLMRYKIGFEFPLFSQKYLQHSHSHFAFAGWVSHALMTLIVYVSLAKLSAEKLAKYNLLIACNLVAAYGMLIGFALQGYTAISIFFSTSSIVISFLFCYIFYKDFWSKQNELSGKNWFLGALFFNVISSLGTFYLVYMMVTKNIPQHDYLASIYWYLHFQYNGWFFFAIMGIFTTFLAHTFPAYQQNKNIFKLFAYSCIPAYGLSVLWLELPLFLLIIIAIAALAQLIGLVLLVKELKALKFLHLFQQNKLARLLWISLFVALVVKLLLQAFSTIPTISHFAFGFRPVVIAYLHLVLLAIISLFILTFYYSKTLIPHNKSVEYGLVVFLVGIVLNEALLALQGLSSIIYVLIPYINLMLLIAALVLFSGIFMVGKGLRKS